MAFCTGMGFTENVVPERCFSNPTCGSDANPLRAERGDSQVTGYGFTRREPDALAALQVTDGERMVVVNLTHTGNSRRQRNQCSHQLPIDVL
jgi:hypothetical protein